MASFRQPTTTNTTDFWWCDPSSWAAWLSEAGSSDKKRRNAALLKLRKYHKTGLIMETNAGVLAAVPCSVCARPGALGRACWVETGVDEACAYCRQNNKSACTALEHAPQMPPPPPPPPPPPLSAAPMPTVDVEGLAVASALAAREVVERGLAASEARAAGLEVRVAELERRLQREVSNGDKVREAFGVFKEETRRRLAALDGGKGGKQ
ncbi:hypothetical protein LTR95_015148 [Oleoguttula sp. CCFEE 5521]